MYVVMKSQKKKFVGPLVWGRVGRIGRRGRLPGRGRAYRRVRRACAGQCVSGYMRFAPGARRLALVVERAAAAQSRPTGAARSIGGSGVLRVFGRVVRG